MAKHIVTIEGSYEGDLRVRATHGPSRHSLVTDAPIDNHGKGESFSPTDLVVTAMGTCICTILGILAERHSINLSSMRFVTTKEMVAQPRRRLGRVVTTLYLPASLDDKQRALLEAAAHTCPVHESLRPEVEAIIEFVYEDSSTRM